jgi:DNA-binding transcriptional regulator YiaG
MVMQPDAAANAELAELLEKLRRTRQRSGSLTQQGLAEVLKVRTGSVQDWELGRDSPTMIHLIRWVRVLGFHLVVDDRLGPAEHPPRAIPGDGFTWEMLEIARLATALAQARKRRGIRQANLAAQLGVSRWSITRWESAQGHPRPIGLVAWARALECRIRLPCL